MNRLKPDIGEIHYFARREASPGGTNHRGTFEFGFRTGFQVAVEIVREGGSADEMLAKLRRIAPLQGDQARCVVCERERPTDGRVCACGARWP